jgi:hypothetical protein
VPLTEALMNEINHVVRFVSEHYNGTTKYLLNTLVTIKETFETEEISKLIKKRPLNKYDYQDLEAYKLWEVPLICLEISPNEVKKTLFV